MARLLLDYGNYSMHCCYDSGTCFYCGCSSLNGVFNLIGLLSIILDDSANNLYVQASHQYTDNMLRIIVPTSDHEGTVYVLPSAGIGLDAVWSPKIADETSGSRQRNYDTIPTHEIRKMDLERAAGPYKEDACALSAASEGLRLAGQKARIVDISRQDCRHR